MLLPDTATHCPLHGDPLREELVPIVYGLVRHSGAFRRAHRERFPMAKFLVHGGCALQRPIFETAQVCDLCRAAHLAWCKEAGCTEGLPSPDFDIEFTLRRHWRILRLTVVVPPEVYTLLDSGNHIAALKLLKRANMQVAIADLRACLRILRFRDDMDAADKPLRLWSPPEGVAALWRRNLPDRPPS